MKIGFFKKRDTSDESLIQGCLKCEPKAQYALYEKYAPVMLSVCRRYTGDLDAAQDVLSTGFLKVFTKLSQYNQTGSFEGWIRRVIIRECIDFLRSNKKGLLTVESEIPDVIDTDSDDQAYLFSIDELMEMIDGLPGGYKAVFIMHVIDGLKHTEIADTLGISEGTSKSQLSKSRNLLRIQCKERLNAGLANGAR
jgi:RNA polymerase sigma-70 factor, ECF subfamily